MMASKKLIFGLLAIAISTLVLASDPSAQDSANQGTSSNNTVNQGAATQGAQNQTPVIQPIAAPSSTTTKISQIDASSFPRIKLFVSVKDENSLPVKDLLPQNFTISEDGKDVGTLSFSTFKDEKTPLSIGFIVDVSGSMYNALPLEKEAVNNFITRLRPDDRGAIISFSDQVRIEQGFTEDKEALRKSVMALQSFGQTRLFDAVIEGIEILLSEEDRRLALIVLTDGMDNRSANHLQEVMAQYKMEVDKEGRSFSIFTIGLGDQINTGELDQLAVTTGGTFLLSPTPSELGDVYEKILTQIVNEYVIAYESPNRDEPAKIVRVVVSSNAVGTVSEGEAFYRLPGLAGEVARLSWPAILLTLVMTIILILLTIFKMQRGVWLTAMITPLEGKDFKVVGSTVGIGWAEDNPVMVRFDRKMPDYAARLVEGRDGYSVESLAPDYPVYFQGRPIRRATLRNGEDFIIGTIRFIFHEKILRKGETFEPETDRVEAISEEALRGAEVPPGFKAESLVESPIESDVPMLVVRGGPMVGRRFELSGSITQIGRTGDRIRIEGDIEVSRRHCEVLEREGRHYLRDAGSKNGTFLDDRRVEGEVALKPGSRIRVGRTVLVYYGKPQG